MRLQTLAAGCVIGAVAGLLLLAGFGVLAWQRIAGGVDGLGRLADLRAELVSADVALDYLTLLRSDQQIAVATAADLRRLAARVNELPYDLAAPAVAHLAELALLADALTEFRGRALLMDAPDAERDAVMMIATQVRIHQSGLAEAMNGMLREQRIELFRLLFMALATFIGATLLFATMALAGFVIVRRRLRGPLRVIEEGIAAFSAGDLDSRIALAGDDEFGRLAASFNAMVGQRQRDERLLRDSESRLRQSQRLEAVGQLTGGIAHDFNNLLTVILGNAELLSGELADQPRLARLADMVSGAAQRGAELTRRLLAFGRRQALEPRSVDITQLLAGLAGLLRRSLGEQVQVNVQFAAGLWNALVDPGQLENALLNLAINARDAMPDGGQLTIKAANIRLDPADLEASAEVAPGEYVQIVVTDTGTGIQPEHLERVFEPFFSTKEPGSGSGLGLAMVYGFIRQSRGHVRIVSTPGEGTCVEICLPRSPAVAHAGRTRLPDAAVPGGGESILLVEDDAAVRSHAHEQLEALGYRVLAAGSGADALSLLQAQGPVDLLLTDVVMPGGMSGPQLAEQAGRLQPGLAVLFASGYTGSSLPHDGRAPDGVRLLAKPYRRSELAQAVHAALKR